MPARRLGGAAAGRLAAVWAAAVWAVTVRRARQIGAAAVLVGVLLVSGARRGRW